VVRGRSGWGEKASAVKGTLFGKFPNTGDSQMPGGVGGLTAGHSWALKLEGEET